MKKAKRLTGLFVMLLLMQNLSIFAQRITVSGNEFRVNNEQIWLNGTNTPWDKWNDFGGAFNYSWWNTEFQELQDLHINCTRVWITCDGNNAGINISNEGFINSVNSTFWSHVDQLMEIAQTKQVYLMIALISFDHTKPGNPNAPKWINMYNSANNRQSFVDNYAIPFVNRYKDNPYFFAIEAGNELEWAWENHGVSSDSVMDLISRFTDGVKANSNVLVCQGLGAGIKYNTSAHGGSGNYLADINVDFYNVHFYDWQDQWFGNPFDLSPSDYKINTKPCIIGEAPAKGAAGYTPLECYQKAFEKGWRGLMVWTSNGVDDNGNKYDSKPGTDYIYNNYKNRVPPVDNVQIHKTNTNAGYGLNQNAPNPFDQSTTIHFTLPRSGYVSIDIYDITGVRIKSLTNGWFPEGGHSITWDASDNKGNLVRAGIYFLKLASGEFTATKQMMVID